MPPIQEMTHRLADLLRDPRETPEVEIKNWLDITGTEEHRAILAKALIALANHGGGFVVIGFTAAESGVTEAPGRPANLAGYTPDTVNRVVNSYVEPPFHCDVQIVTRPGTELAYPVIMVPGGHQVPIKAKRDGPEGRTIKRNVYYVRRPGPQSEGPQTGQEWDALIRRCVTNSREDLLDRFRTILAGGGTAAPVETDLDRVNRWFDDSLARWQECANTLPPEHPARLPHGHYAAGYQIIGDLQSLTGGALLNALRQGVVRHTGWPPFWVPTREGIAPYPQDGNVECWFGPDGENRDPAHSDFWRASPQGQLFLLRGYDEDGVENTRTAPGTVFDIVLPTWRIGEVLLHAASMAQQFGAPQAQVVLVAEWTGLANRQLASIGNRRRSVLDRYRTRQGHYRTNIAVQADQVGDMLPELVDKIVRPLYEMFGFFRLPETLVSEELSEMRGVWRR